MSDTILITGGAGFIGSHLADELLRSGCRVRALDNLTPQVHDTGERPDYLDDEVELIVGDVRDGDCVRHALHGVDAVVHLAARVGVGQSMYDIADYTSVNASGTATLLQALVDDPVDQLVVASSMSVYGEASTRTRRVGSSTTSSARASSSSAPSGIRSTGAARRCRRCRPPRPRRRGCRRSTRWASTTRSACACCTARRTTCR